MSSVGYLSLFHNDHNEHNDHNDFQGAVGLTHARRSNNSPYSSGALITSRDGIIGHWRQPDGSPPDAVPERAEAMARWSPDIRSHVILWDLLADLTFVAPKASGAGGTIEVAGSPLVTLIAPTNQQLLDQQLPLVRGYADLRRDRSAEILAQVGDLVAFFAGIAHLDEQRTPRTLELLSVLMRATVLAEMRFKHTFALRRPVEFGAQVNPMIPTPSHGSYPSGHAAESFMIAYVLHQLLLHKEKKLYEKSTDHKEEPLLVYRDQLMRQAARVAVNRVIAGVHFPVDNAAGQIVGMTLGNYFVAKGRGSGGRHIGWQFDAPAYCNTGEDYAWRAMTQAFYLAAPTDATKTFLAPTEISLPETPRGTPLRWLWERAADEWNLGDTAPSSGGQ